MIGKAACRQIRRDDTWYIKKLASKQGDERYRRIKYVD